MSDEFFDDERELMERAVSRSVPQPAPAPAPTNASPDRSRPAPPPFWTVLAIAAIALVLGIVIGYLWGSSATLNELAAASQQAQQAEPAAAGAQSVLPEGHPQLDIADDGTAAVADPDSAPDSSSL